MDLTNTVAVVRPGVYLAKKRLYENCDIDTDDEEEAAVAGIVSGQLSYLRWCGTRKKILTKTEAEYTWGRLSTRKYEALKEMLGPPLGDDSADEGDAKGAASEEDALDAD